MVVLGIMICGSHSGLADEMPLASRWIAGTYIAKSTFIARKLTRTKAVGIDTNAAAQRARKSRCEGTTCNWGVKR